MFSTLFLFCTLLSLIFVFLTSTFSTAARCVELVDLDGEALLHRLCPQLAAEYNQTNASPNGQNAVCWAAIKGSEELGRKIVELGISLNSGQCIYGSNVTGSPLQAAAFYRRKHYLQLLLTQPGISRQMINQSGSGSPFHAMALTSDPVIDSEIFLMLQKVNPAAVDSVDKDGRTPFLIAVKSSSLDFAKLLLKRGKTRENAQDHYGFSALHLAQDVETLSFLFELESFSKARGDFPTENDNLTPLHVAVMQNKSITLIKHLLIKMVNTSAANRDGDTAAHIAIKENNSGILEVLLAHGDFPFSVRDKAGRTPVLLSIELGRVELARKLIAIRWPVEKMPGTGDSALHLAAKFNQAEIASVLVKRGNDQTSLEVNLAKETPLHVAINYESVSVVNVLLTQKPPVNQDVDGRTVVHLAAMRCSRKSIEFGRMVVSLFAEVQGVRDRFGDAPLEIAIKRNCFEMVGHFLSNGMNCTFQNRKGYTPLHIAKHLGFKILVEKMVDSGKCFLNQTDACGIMAGDITDPVLPDRCDVLPSIENGMVYKPESMEGFCISTKAEFSCNFGFILRGSNVVECDSTGKWLIKGHCEEPKWSKIVNPNQLTGFDPRPGLPGVKSCKELPLVENGQFASSPFSVSIGWTLTFDCNEGYVLRGSNVVKCDTTGKWLINGYCEEFRCNDVPLVANAVLQTMSSWASIGSNVTFICETGRPVRGLNIIQCNSAGRWQVEGFCDNPLTAAQVETLQKELREAAKDGNVDQIRDLLKLGVLDVNWRSADDVDVCVGCWGWVKNGTALIHAAHQNPETLYEIVDILVENGADVNAPESSTGLCPITFASVNGQLETVTLLLHRGADPNIKDSENSTALMWAASKGHLEIVRILLNRGADVNAKTKHGYTALILAASNGHFETVRLLLNRLADIDARKNNGNSALMLAATNNHREVVHLLLSRGASPEGCTACDLKPL